MVKICAFDLFFAQQQHSLQQLELCARASDRSSRSLLPSCVTRSEVGSGFKVKIKLTLHSTDAVYARLVPDLRMILREGESL